MIDGMATMHPPQFTNKSQRSGILAEKRVYECLQEVLPAEYHCFYPLQMHGKFDPDMQDREADFLIVHEEHGLFLIEVKAEKLTCMPSFWTRKKHGHIEELDLRRMWREQTKTFKGWARERLGCKERDVPFLNEFAFFPDTLQLESKINDAWVGKVFFQDDLKNRNFEKVLLENSSSITGGDLHAFEANKVLTKKLLSVLTDWFSANSDPRLADSVELHVQTAEEITDEKVFKFAEHYYDDESLALVGGAGSGKSRFLVQKARALGAGGHRVLVTCYNNLIEGELKKELKDSPGVDVLNFHNLSRKVIAAAGKTVEPEPADPGKKKAYFDKILPDHFEKALGELPNKHRYDAILVDEAQDFLLDYWMPVRGLFKKKGENEGETIREQLIVAFDPSQVTRPEVGQVDLDFIFGDIKFHTAKLMYNLRSTPKIASYTSDFFPAGRTFKYRNRLRQIELPQPMQRRSTNEEVREIRKDLGSSEKVVEKLGEILEELIDKKGLDSEKITVLVEFGLDKLLDKKLPVHLDLGWNNKIKLVSEPAKPGDVRIETVRRYKGMDSPVVIVLDTGMKDELKYVATSRAISLLYVLDCSKADLDGRKATGSKPNQGAQH